MLIFPQLSSGASVQYPSAKKISQRSTQATMEDGTIISLADSSATYLRWKIVLEDLSDTEAQSFTDFYAATHGNLLPFLFLDPTANLLVWSRDFSQNAWQKAAVSFDSALADPLGGNSAVRAHNLTAANSSITQQTQIPGSVQTCFSIYLRADTPVNATLSRFAGSLVQNTAVTATTSWQRCYVSGSFAGSGDSLEFGIDLPAGTTVELFGPQVDAQVMPSEYVVSTSRSAVYSNARFDSAQMDRIATGPNRNVCTSFVRCNLPVGE